jgi:hypothetical protein
MTRKEAIQACKREIKNYVEQSRSLRQEIRSLKWKPGVEEQFGKIAHARRSLDHVALGAARAGLKAYRRPETGDQRYDLWSRKRSTASQIRALSLVYAILRGRQYKTVEPKTPPMTSWVLSCLVDDVHTWLSSLYPEQSCTQADVEGWLLGMALTIPAEAA